MLVHCVCISLAWRKLFCFLHYFDFEVVLWMLQQEDFLPVVVLVRLERQNSHCSRDSGCPFWQRSFSFFRSACLYGPIIWSSRKDLNWKRNRQTQIQWKFFLNLHTFALEWPRRSQRPNIWISNFIFLPQVASGGLRWPQVASEAKYLKFLTLGFKWPRRPQRPNILISSFLVSSGFKFSRYFFNFDFLAGYFKCNFGLEKVKNGINENSLLSIEIPCKRGGTSTTSTFFLVKNGLFTHT